MYRAEHVRRQRRGVGSRLPAFHGSTPTEKEDRTPYARDQSWLVVIVRTYDSCTGTYEPLGSCIGKNNDSLDRRNLEQCMEKPLNAMIVSRFGDTTLNVVQCHWVTRYGH